MQQYLQYYTKIVYYTLKSKLKCQIGTNKIIP